MLARSKCSTTRRRGTQMRRMSDEEFRRSAEAGLRALHAKGEVTSAELKEDVERLRSGDDDGETSTWIMSR